MPGRRLTRYRGSGKYGPRVARVLNADRVTDYVRLLIDLICQTYQRLTSHDATNAD